MSQEEVGKHIGKSKQMVGYYESGRNQPSYAILLSLAELFEVEVKRFSRDKATDNERLKEQYFRQIKEEENSQLQTVSESNSKQSTEKTLLFLSELPEKDAEYYIPYYDVEVTAGRIEVYFNDEVDETPAGYLYAPAYQGCVMVYLKGDSMYDRIFPGSRLYVYYMKDKKYIDFGQVFLIVLPGERLLKYIFPHPTDERKVILRSHNTLKYPDLPVEKEDIVHLFKVKGYENQSAI